MSEVFNEPKKRINGVYIPYGVMAHAHVHAYIEILYGLEGRYTLQTNENSITFSAGDMVLIHAHEVHQVFALAEGTNRYIVIKFEPELVQAADSTVFELKYLLSFRLPAHNLPRFSPAMCSPVAKCPTWCATFSAKRKTGISVLNSPSGRTFVA